MKDNILLTEIKCLLCNTSDSKIEFIYKLHKKPDNETEFGIPDDKYKRSVYKCNSCGVYFNWHDILPSNLYESNYNQATYQKKILKTYSRIMALNPDKSDNKHRVQRIIQFLILQDININKASVLDVGSGLCVFLGELKKYGVYSVCIDPDPLSARHALENVCVDEAHAGTLNDFHNTNRFNLITFNKVLEHVEEPISLLLKAKEFLDKNGCIYVELPDGDSALKNGNIIDREEFYIEHFTIYNELSIQYLAEQAGLTCTNIHSIHEPSDKYTIYAFMKPII